jgi:hypothetical protein
MTTVTTTDAGGRSALAIGRTAACSSTAANTRPAVTTTHLASGWPRRGVVESSADHGPDRTRPGPARTLSSQRMSASVAVFSTKTWHPWSGGRQERITAQHASRGDADYVTVPRANQAAPPIVINRRSAYPSWPAVIQPAPWSDSAVL